MHLYVGATQGAHFQPQNMTLLTCWHRYSHFWLLLITLLFSLPTQASPMPNQKQPLPDLASQTAPQPTKPLTEQQVASLVQQTATLLSAKQPGQQAARVAVNQANRLASQTSERWLSRFGRARVNLGTDHRFKQFQGELAILLPLDESCSRPLTFSQLAVNYFDSEPTANLGIGQRHLLNDWLLGYNAFIDQHLQRPHTRIGVGAELWRDYLKISGNSYWALSRWKESKKIESFEEKVANGFDLRLQGYLPSYPQLGAQLMLENYFGDQVALFEKTAESLQKNPLATTVGITYTPIPLITASVDHKMGKNSQKETRFNLQFDYLLDLPWEQQIDPKRVDLQRQLTFSKYDWVQRNNRLVMQYRQLTQITLELPPLIEGYAGEQKPLDANVTARFGFKEIEWNSSELITAGGNIKLDNDTRYQVTLPTAIGTYPLSGIAIDQQGNRSTIANTQIKVNPWISLSLPANIVGQPGESIEFRAEVKSYFKLSAIEAEKNEEFEKFTADGGELFLNPDDLENLSITLPKEENSYQLTAIAIDEKGNRSTPVTGIITVSKTPVDPEPKPLKIIIPDNMPSNTLLYDEKIKLSAEGGDDVYIWESTNPTVLEVDKDDGMVTFKGAGKTQIKLSSEGKEVQTEIDLSDKPLLKFLRDGGSKITYDEVVNACNLAGGNIVTKKNLDDAAKERKSWIPLAEWAGSNKGLALFISAKDPDKQLQTIHIGGLSGDKDEGLVQDVSQKATVPIALCEFKP